LGRGGYWRRILEDVHSSPAGLPELQEFLGAFQVRFRRTEGAEALERYVTGLLTELPNKNCDTIAQAVPGTTEQRLQEFLTNMPWDEADLNRQRVEKMRAEATLGDGVLVLDDTGFRKQGNASVGVARQYSGTLGKVGNCQIAVTRCDADPQASWPVAVRLSIPKNWADDHDRRRKARLPDEISFQTKPELALALLDEARAWGVPHRCVVADADNGDNPNFLTAGRRGRGRMWWRCGAGASPVMGDAMWTGCWGSAPHAANRRSANTPGAICPQRLSWRD
jgi:SRSO17 transposase